MLRCLLLLAKRLAEGCDRSNDSNGNERERDERPDDTPALGGAAISLSKLTRVRGVHFAEDQVIALSRWQSARRSTKRQKQHSRYPRHYREQT